MIRFKNIQLFLALLFILTIFSISCGERKDKFKPENGSDLINVVTTTGMVGDAVEHIGGSFFKVTTLMGPGVDPHLYKASEGDVTRLDRADLIVYSGLHLEGKMGNILQKMSRHKPVIAVGELLPENLLRSPPEFKGQHDPHIWFDLAMWSRMVSLLGDKLAEHYPDYRNELIANATAYSAEISAMHNSVRDSIATIPQSRRVLITAHDAFGYFGLAYDIEVKGLQGISTVSEYGLKDVTDLVDHIVERQIKAVFIESSVPVKSIEAVQQGAIARGKNIKIGGELFSDALGAKNSPEGNYLGMVRHNVDTIVHALR